MIKKMTKQILLDVIPVIIMFGIIAAIFLGLYGPAALEALQGQEPKLARTEPISKIYSISALGLFFLLVDVFIIFWKITHSATKKVKSYLEANPTVTRQQLESDFGVARQIGNNLWIGKQWTFCCYMKHIPVENSKIVLVYSETMRIKGSIIFSLCLGLVDGKVEKTQISKDDFSRIKRIYARYPHILMGNNPDYIYMFQNDRNAFLNIKYYSSEIQQ